MPRPISFDSPAPCPARHGVAATTLLLGTVASLLSACGGGGGSGSDSASLNGVAAVGSPLASAAVSARCAAGPELSGTTASDGSFTLNLTGGQTPPCILRVSGGSPSVTLHSYAEASGRVNITPVTELVVARAAGGAPAAAFDNFNASTRQTLSAGLPAALSHVRTQLDAVGVALPSGDLLTGQFAANPGSDPMDQALERLQSRIDANPGQSLDSLRSAVLGETTFASLLPTAAATGGSTGGSTGGTTGGSTGGTTGGTPSTGGSTVTFGAIAYTERSAPTGASKVPGGLVWDGSKFVGLEQSTDFHNAQAKFSAWTSPDGITWTRTTTDLNSHFVALAGMNGKVFQVLPGWQSGGTFQTVKVSSSSDGISWQSVTVSDSGFSTSVLQGGKYLNGRYFLSTDTDCMLITSADAASWSVVDLKTVATSSVSVAPSGYCSLPVYRGGKYYVYRGVAGVGGSFRSPDHYEGAYYSSTDGLVWTLGTYALPAGFDSMPGSGRSFDVEEVGDILVIASVKDTTSTSTPQGQVQSVVANQVATSTDGLTWTVADASGVSYSATEAGKPGPSTFFHFTTPSGALTANSILTCSSTACTSAITYYLTRDGRTYTSTGDYGLVANNRVHAYSDSLRRLVVLDGGSNGSTLKLGSIDFPAP